MGSNVLNKQGKEDQLIKVLSKNERKLFINCHVNKIIAPILRDRILRRKETTNLVMIIAIYLLWVLSSSGHKL